MQLAERHIIQQNNLRWKSLNQICFLSKNLYNQALYRLKQYYKKKSAKFKSAPRPPQFKNKIKGRNIIVFTSQQVKIKDGYINFPKKNGLKSLKTKVPNINQIRIIPQSACYVIEVVYTVNLQDLKLNKENVIGIDLGINNLVSIQSNQCGLGLRPLLINGRILKSVNQFYNKTKAYLQSLLSIGKHVSKRILRLTLKRNNVIRNYMHHVSKFIVRYCIQNDIGSIVIGKNDGWKQKVNIGKRNNQNFVSIPFEILINQIEYKSKMVGIDVKTINESYTSKCSAFDLEPICKHESYLGKRIKRGLFQTSNGFLVNAVINGATNILRKEIGNGFITKSELNSGIRNMPVKIQPLVNSLNSLNSSKHFEF